MLKSIEGVYRDGKVELSESPGDVREETRVIVTFVEPGGIELSERGFDEVEAAKLRDSLAPFAEDWDTPEMSAYDDYDAAKKQRP